MENCIWMLKNNTHTQMMSFVILDKSGKVIVIDGGNTLDAPYLLQRLRELTGQKKPHVDAWFFTHAHSDHVHAFYELYDKYLDCFSFDKIYCNFPSKQYLALDGAATLQKFYDLQGRIYHKVVTVSVGDVYQIGEAKFEVLYTADTRINDNWCNNSSTVFKMTLGDRRVLFLGDLGVEGGHVLMRNMPEAIKCDTVQMAHHGQEGVDEAFYNATECKTCLWCAPDWLWDNDRGGGFNTASFKTVIVRGWMEKMGVKEHYVIKDGDQLITC